MNLTARRLRSIGWVATLVVCAALVMVLAFRVNALRSQVHRSQARIIALKQETMYLETEFETRANQQQLKAWNDVEFGYVAPVAGQYLDTERELASYAKPAEPGAPAPIRVASTDDQVAAAAVFPAMVSPMTGKPVDDGAPTVPAATKAHDGTAVRTGAAAAGGAVAALGLSGLSDRLGTVRHGDHALAARKPGKAKDGKKPAKDAKPKAAKPKAGATTAHKADGKGPALHAARAAHGHLAMAAAKPAHAGAAPIRLALREAKAAK
jgi:hypothetical protein